jgi:raffinose/stachyose/melibiose transport system substrate-binding protein
VIRAKKQLSAILIAALAASTIWGCSKDTPANNDGDKKEGNKQVTIRVASTFTGADPYTPIWQEVLKDFSTKYPDIKVIDEATSAAGDAFKTKVNADFASGNEPDVVYGFNGEIGRPICESGKVITWEEELKNDSAWAANFSPGPLESGKFEGKLYCLPYLGFFEGMWVNKDVFENNGLQVPKTYEDIVKAIPVLREKDITPIACSFAEEPHYIIETFLLSMGGKAGHDNPFDESWAPALNLLKDLYEKKAFTEDALTIKQASCAELFANKKAAMFVSGSWSGGQFTDKENTSVIPLPLVPGGKADPTDIIGGAGTGWYLVKKLNDEKNGAGMKFIKYMTQPEVIAKFVAVSGVNCIKCDVKADSKMKQSGIDLINNAKSISSPIGDVMNQEAFTTIWKGLGYVVTGEKTAEQLLQEAQKLAK